MSAEDLEPSPMDLSPNAIADRVNCCGMGDWLDALADHGGTVLRAPLGRGREMIDIPIVKLGLTVTLFRHPDERLSEQDQVVMQQARFDAARAALPFGLDAHRITPAQARDILSYDTAGCRTADLKRNDTRMTFFLPEDARIVALTFNPSLVGITSCAILRLGGEIPYPEISSFFGTERLCAAGSTLEYGRPSSPTRSASDGGTKSGGWGTR